MWTKEGTGKSVVKNLCEEKCGEFWEGLNISDDRLHITLEFLCKDFIMQVFTRLLVLGQFSIYQLVYVDIYFVG